MARKMISLQGAELPLCQTISPVLRVMESKEGVITIFIGGNLCDQSSVAEWLRRWANLGVITTTELLGGRGFESHSRHE